MESTDYLFLSCTENQDSNFDTYAVDREVDISEFELTEDEINFIDKVADTFEAGAPSLKTKKILNRLLALGVVVQLNK